MKIDVFLKIVLLFIEIIICVNYLRISFFIKLFLLIELNFIIYIIRRKIKFRYYKNLVVILN